MTLTPRVVTVFRRTEYDQLVERHGTRQQIAFFLSSRERTLDEVDDRHRVQRRSLDLVGAAIPIEWRRGQVERADLDRFAFAAEDIVVAVGQDGLVANLAKYLDGQPVIGVDPEPERNPGLLVPHAPAAVTALLHAVAHGQARFDTRTMVEAALDDGQRLRALNEIYIGHPSHQSARYRIVTPTGASERQSSSGVLVGTGTGSTGWCRSVWLERHAITSIGQLPSPLETALCWFVREAWPSPATGNLHTEGFLSPTDTLTIVAESDLVVFGDGIESDSIALRWGQSVTVRIADKRLRCVLA